MTHKEKLIVARLLKAISDEDRAVSAFDEALASKGAYRALLRHNAELAIVEARAANMAVAELVRGYEIS